MSGASNRPLRVDQIARGIFGRAAIATGTHDAELAIEVCRELGEIESAYRLALRCGDDVAERRAANDAPQSPARFVGRPMAAKFAGRCAVCAQSISVGAEILYAPELRRAAHVHCGEVQT